LSDQIRERETERERESDARGRLSEAEREIGESERPGFWVGPAYFVGPYQREGD